MKMNRTDSFLERIFVALSLAVLLAAPLLAQAPSGQQQERPSMKGAVIKGKAPVSKDTLKV
jgi:hypothetical protein